MKEDVDRARELRAKVASARRWNKPELEDLQRELKEVMLERAIMSALADGPELLSEQRDRLARLLAPPTASPSTTYKPDPRYAWIGQKRKAAARRLADAQRLTAEADRLQKEIDQ